MAEATSNTRVIPQHEVTEVTLVLSEHEAQVLLKVLNNVTGSPKRSYRKDCDAIAAALRYAGTYVPIAFSEYINGSISWSDSE